jgi:hypothetical protein
VDWKRRYELPERNVQWRYGVQGEVLVSGCESRPTYAMLLHLFLPAFLDAAFPSILCFDPNHERKHQRRRQDLFIFESG